MYYPQHIPSHHDETIIPILCSSQNPQTTPVKMRIVLKSPSFSVPKAQRMYSGADHRYVQYPYQHRLSPPPHTSPLSISHKRCDNDRLSAGYRRC
ncbi:unnamed protein product, partial [Adineta steineri]